MFFRAFREVRLHHELVDVHARWKRRHPSDALADVVRGQGRQPGIDAICGGLVAAETHFAELGVDHSWENLGHPHRLAEQLVAQRLGHAVRSELRGVVSRTARVSLDAGDRGHIHNVAVT